MVILCLTCDACTKAYLPLGDNADEIVKSVVREIGGTADKTPEGWVLKCPNGHPMRQVPTSWWMRYTIAKRAEVRDEVLKDRTQAFIDSTKLTGEDMSVRLTPQPDGYTERYVDREDWGIGYTYF